ncbi:MAG: TIGR04211 family SH3 domain-containing protein [Candidatus Electrothrix sp. AW2]|jgi:SH3 domain protein|nr:TIGR04211 family SH3 domain-containing protein [Candidatus Electrothrix sp. AX1]MCI5116894.1 TIGR04211 family SH3 domain-containing protein [Candidatus Electrothrix gigas]MCI5127774.1 TIGR04211 family SH3 domain-containing protein [Candidatus Electrothrix gigas]MCI5133513.1 TIGR04211 family SH3 domain-containing protein [Candidatus Electrothrix gigas]MCI5177946.1 TIGR04211 family SH3 domain-containing protein [Candidatus Electrothrix gigas]
MTQKSHKAKFLFIISLLTALITGIAGAADIKFVRPDLDIPVRRGRGERYRILKFVKDGDQLELIRENGNWAKVRLTGGTEGWMLNRYLSDEQPPLEQVRILREENEKIKAENEKLAQNLKRIKDLQEASTEELEQLQTSAEKKLAQSLQECNKIKDEHKAAQEVNKIMWFLSGAGVLLLGWLIGRFSSGSQRKRNRLL